MNIDYTSLKDNCIEWIRNWFDANGPKCNAVIGMSGGKDSTVAAALCADALGKDRVIGVALPSGNQSLNGADEICRRLGIRWCTLNIGNAEAALSSLGVNLEPDSPSAFSPQTVLNIPPRLRMTALYAIAQTYNGMVANTCNLSEDYIGYATLFGDAAGSFSPLRKLCVREVRGIGHALGLPSEWVDKTPDDGLPGSCPDETKFGFSYDVLDHYIREGECKDAEIKSKIDTMHRRNTFKTEILNIPAFDPELPILGCNAKLPEVILKETLTASGSTLSVAESCTGGRISHLITSVSGSSAYYLGSVTSYAIALKESILGVDSGVIEECGVVSEMVATAMADGVRRLTGSTWALATTGWADRSGDSHEGPGTAWIAVAGPDGKTVAKRLKSTEKPSAPAFRKKNIGQFSAEALEFLVSVIEHK